MLQLPDIFGKIRMDINPLKRSFTDAAREGAAFRSRVQGDFAGLGNSARALMAPLAGVASQLAKMSAVGVGAGVAGVAGLAAWSVKLAAEAEQAQVSFEVMLGSLGEARAMLADINKFGAATPFSTAGLTEASKTLLNFGVAGDQVMPVLDALSNVAAGNEQRMKQLALVYGQISSSGRLMGQDLMQLINAGFNPLTSISKRTGESMAELKKRMEAGALGLGEVQQAFVDATSKGGQFYQMNEKQSRTLIGRISTLRDEVSLMFTQLGTSITENLDLKAATQGIGIAVKSMADLSLPHIERFTQSLGSISVAGDAAAAGFMPSMEAIATGAAKAIDALDWLDRKRGAAGEWLKVKGLEVNISLQKGKIEELEGMLELRGLPKESKARLGADLDVNLHSLRVLEHQLADARAEATRGPLNAAAGVTQAFKDLRASMAANSLNARIDAALNNFFDGIDAKPTLKIDTSGLSDAFKATIPKDWLKLPEVKPPAMERLMAPEKGLRERLHEQLNEPRFASFIRADSADAFRFTGGRDAGSDEVQRKQLSVQERSEKTLSRIEQKLNFKVVKM